MDKASGGRTERVARHVEDAEVDESLSMIRRQRAETLDAWEAK